jgi:hypothetical protein
MLLTYITVSDGNNRQKAFPTTHTISQSLYNWKPVVREKGQKPKPQKQGPWLPLCSTACLFYSKNADTMGAERSQNVEPS